MPGPFFATPPQQWQFDEAHRKRHEKRFWRCPSRLVTSGEWAKVWREEGTRRGGGVLSSVLPLLALHTWPGKLYLGEGPKLSAPSPAWATWHYLSHRRIARLAGVNTETVGKVFDRLEELTWLERRKLPPKKYVGGPARYEYRLSTALYSSANSENRTLEPYAGIGATLFYGGIWSLLPTAAARHLYVTIACLDPVRNEVALAERLDEDNFLREDEAVTLQDVRERHPRSVAELADASGMTRSTVEEALEILTTPLYWRDESNKTTPQDLPLVSSGLAAGAAGKNGVKWYGVERAATTWFWQPDVLNDRVRRDRTQAASWPKLAKRRAEQEARAKAKREKTARAEKFRTQVLERAAREPAGGRSR